MKTLYRKDISKQETKFFDYEEPTQTKKYIKKCKDCKYYITCNSKITKKNFNLNHKKARHSFYYILENQYDGCILKKKGEKNGN